jgi:hypothetical protein
VYGFAIVYSLSGWLGLVRLGQLMIIQLILALFYLRAFTVYSSMGWLGVVRLGKHIIIYLLFAFSHEIIASQQK